MKAEESELAEMGTPSDAEEVELPDGVFARLKSAPLVVIDPGHGGRDGGAVSKLGKLTEKEIVFAVAQGIKSYSEETESELEQPFRIELTRTSDASLSLSERTAIANKRKAALFISLHVNASDTGGKANGLEVYYLDTEGDQAAIKLAERENRVDKGAELDDLQFILSDLIQSGKMDESIRLAHYIEDEVVLATKKRWPAIKSLGVRKAPFFVLVGAHMPCVLVELFFIDNQADYKRLSTPQFRSALARGIVRAIKRFLQVA